MYRYEDFKEWLATPEGQVSVLHAAIGFYDIHRTYRGGVAVENILPVAHCGSWKALAAIDRLVELQVLELAEDHEITQYKKYRKGPKWGR